MKKTIDKDTQQKIALGVIVYIIAIVVFNNTVIGDLNKKIKAKKTSVDMIKVQHAQALAKIANINQIKDKYEKQKTEYGNKAKAFIEENEKKVVLKEIEEIGKKHSIKIETISLSKSAPSITAKLDGTPVIDTMGQNVDMTKYKEYKIQMIFKASYPDFVNFIGEIEEMEKLILVQQMELNSDGKEMTAKILLKSYLLETGGV